MLIAVRQGEHQSSPFTALSAVTSASTEPLTAAADNDTRVAPGSAPPGAAPPDHTRGLAEPRLPTGRAHLERMGRLAAMARAAAPLGEEIATAERNAQGAREGLARRLGLPASALLDEEGVSVFAALRQAREHETLANRAIERGDDTAAGQAQADARLALRNAAGLIAAASISVDGHDAAMADVTARLAANRIAMPAAEATWARMQRTAPADVLAAYGDRLVSARTRIQRTEMTLERAREAHAGGAVIGSMRLLGAARLLMEQTAAALAFSDPDPPR
ncbi:MAG: hypothetical protein ACAI38_23920 [Myxococcota bacterium]